MAAKGRTLSERFARWQVLVNNLKESGLIPHVAEEIARLETLLGEARALQDRQDHFRAQSQELTTKLLGIAREGDDLRGRLGANLQGKVGFRNEELLRYGFKPRRLPTRRRKKDQAAAKQQGTEAAGAAQGSVAASQKTEGPST
jgi:hypothetical protein